MSTGKEASVPSDAAATDRLNGSVGAAPKRPRDSEGVERYGGPASNPRTEALSEILGCAHAHGCCESSEAELARRELLELVTAPDADGIWNMTRARMRQHEYYFIVQRKLARHYCWLELLSRPTSVMAHDRRSLYASCAFLCVSPQSRCWAVSAARLPGYNRRAHTTRDSLDTDRREFDSKMVARQARGQGASVPLVAAQGNAEVASGGGDASVSHAAKRPIQLPACHAADEAAHESTLFSMES
ncbi:hypothetical protein EMIHUDRAFT_248217 [Emiliania huxleyi CCMP1516]|uniref:Uncharacterized protein n=2 Tax=Emiliania huxleyi TaxID=2903 RepID=A0A0D3IHR9_EMIH1|nr:hypothetical protein EMIHUDRAFT_248217 [Emiliania huxleyi CCMP1516]EOD10804.1 hypothetical protein EMIHUDRAFT_248217 [Emiliania huxleyi CCMP1516]|eukprot:XP_005763233.1 hypothetical protein EMIHUDRAFT_248217 [Emiliania huxleyi CCMP1516]